MKNLDIYCVTNKRLEFLEKTSLKLVGVGNGNFSQEYISCNTKKNIYYKEKYYSELTFHYWYWKNILQNEKKEWVGFCQKRRYWIKPSEKKSLISQENLKCTVMIEVRFSQCTSLVLCLCIKFANCIFVVVD